jgi:methyl-accepting chemotaxis protein
MRIHSTAILGLLAFSACHDLGGSFMARGDETRPAQILKSQGLERQSGKPSNWSLAVEADVIKQFRAAKSIARRLAAARETQQEMAMGNHNPRDLIDSCRAQIGMGEARITEIDQQLASLGASVGNAAADNWHNLLVRERNSFVREQRRLGNMIDNLARQGTAMEQQRQNFNDDFGRLRESYRDAVEDLRKAVDKIQKNYAKLEQNPAIAKALADLSASTRLKQKLAPSKDLREAIKWLEDNRRIGSERSRRTGPRSKR